MRLLLDDDKVGKVGRVEAVDIFDEEMVAVFDVDVQHGLLGERVLGKVQVVKSATGNGRHLVPVLAHRRERRADVQHIRSAPAMKNTRRKHALILADIINVP